MPSSAIPGPHRDSSTTESDPTTGTPRGLSRRAAVTLPALGALVVGGVAAGATAAYAASTSEGATATYPDPMAVTGDYTVHDPSMVRCKDGSYLLAATAPGITLRRSKDGKAWTYEGRVWTTGAEWTDVYTGESDANLWAPDLTYVNGQFYLYYAASSFGSNHSGIFLATSRTGNPGEWTNQGLVYETVTTNDFNAIDPNLLIDEQGRWWMAMGSFWTGLKMIRLNERTGKASTRDTEVRSIASRSNTTTAIEAPSITYHAGYYYLFVSWDSCCSGVSSTYNIKVGRSKKPTGPYLDKDGVDLMDSGGTQLLASHGRYIGTGGQSVLVDAKGVKKLVYHYYDGEDSGIAKLGVNTLVWGKDGWPTLR